MADVVPDNLGYALMRAQIDLSTADLYCALLDATAGPNVTAGFYDAYTAVELPNANGYTTSGLTISDGDAVTVTGPGSTTTFDSTANPSWSSFTHSTRYALVWERVGTGAANSPVIGVFDFGTTTVTNGTLTINWNGSGLMTIAAS